MKKILALLLAVVFVGSLSFAAEKAAKLPKKTLSGDIIDNICAVAHQADLAEFVKTHAKECALMPDCVKSGYSLYTDGNLLAFDDASNAKIAKFLQKKKSTLQVKVKVKVGDKLNLLSIGNKKVEKKKEKK